MPMNSYAMGLPRTCSKFSALLLHYHATEPDRLLGLHLRIHRHTYRLTRMRTIAITGEVIVTLHRIDRWADTLTRSLHLL